MNTTLHLPADYAQLESVLLDLPVEARQKLTHVLIRSIDENVDMSEERLQQWLDHDDRVFQAVKSGQMETVDAFDALARVRSNISKSS